MNKKWKVFFRKNNISIEIKNFVSIFEREKKNIYKIILRGEDE